jgi:hypothetical protein
MKAARAFRHSRISAHEFAHPTAERINRAVAGNIHRLYPLARERRWLDETLSHDGNQETGSARAGPLGHHGCGPRISRMAEPTLMFRRPAVSSTLIVSTVDDVGSYAAIPRRSRSSHRLMIFKPLCAASKTGRRLDGTNHLPKVIAGVKFQDGIEVIQVPANHAA